MLTQLHLDRWAEVLVKHATDIQPGKIVRINAQPSAERLLEAVYRQVLIAGGLPPRVACEAAIVQPLSDDRDVTAALTDAVALAF